MSDEKLLTEQIAEKYLPVEDSLELGEFTSIEDAAAKILSKFEGELYLNGLTRLSDSAADSLSKFKGGLHLDGLTSLSDAAAESLSKVGWSLNLNGLKSLSDTAAESLCKFEGGLHLDGLTSLSDAAAESLSNKAIKNGGYISLENLTSISDAAAESLAKKYDNGIYLSEEGETPLDNCKLLISYAHHDGRCNNYWCGMFVTTVAKYRKCTGKSYTLVMDCVEEDVAINKLLSIRSGDQQFIAKVQAVFDQKGNEYDDDDENCLLGENIIEELLIQDEEDG